MICQKCTVMPSIEQLPFSWRWLWQKNTATGHHKQNNRRRGQRDWLFYQNLCVLYVFLTDINCLSGPINRTLTMVFPIQNELGIFITGKGKQMFIQHLIFPKRLSHSIFLPWSIFLLLPFSPRKAQHRVVLFVYSSESPIKLMLMGGDNTCFFFCCQYYYKGPIFQSVFP